MPDPIVLAPTNSGLPELLKGSGGAAFVSDAIDLVGNSQIQLAISSVAAQTAALTAGLYDVWTTVDCYLKVATTANDVTTSTGYLLSADNVITLVIPEQMKLGAITATGSGTLSLHRVR